MGTKQTPFQPDRAGQPTPIKVHPGMVVSHDSHAQSRGIEHAAAQADGAQRKFSGGIDPRVGGKSKHVRPTPVHGGMTSRQLALKGMQHANAAAPDANPASPLSKEPAGKAFIGRAVGINPGTIRDRFDDPLHGGNPDPRNMKQQMNGRKAHAQQRHAANVEIGRQVLAEALRTK